MTYLAPRQGLFAIIVLVSFLLQTLLLVISTDQQLTKSREQKGEQMIAQLIDEARLSLENEDRVSLSVIANRYTSEQDIARLVIEGDKDETLVQVGNAPMQQGVTISQIATNGDAVIGRVALTLKDISKGEIIALQWPFVIGSLLLHLLLWGAYGYIARPTKEQINALSRDIDNLHREQAGQLPHGRQSNASHAVDNDNVSKGRISNNPANKSSKASNKKADNTVPAQEGITAYFKSQKNNDYDVDLQASSNNATGSTVSDNSAEVNRAHEHVDTNTKFFTPSSSKLSASRPFDSVSVQIMFHDEYKMLERLTPEMRIPYLALCTQLLNQALIELLKQPLLLGVSVSNSPRFDDNGACAVLKADNDHAKVALAGVMLGKLYLMLNKIIHTKHIELSRFALPAKAGISDQAQAPAMKQLMKSVGRKEQMLILLPNAGLKQIGSHVQVHSLKRPTTVYERECAVFDGGNTGMMERLAEVRNAVLMSGNEED
ncbi:hypothetical protein ES754_09380 [Psychrobacter frigidicola]|uniref:Histidine kinase BarA N-terminal domain-containing protein n=1 Tax=Psychrobacter frigidicola TaxID=45611 RepID=A0A5C6ZZ55_9GAMM|nr:hypothetical protein [Psychrobacter frigidicola]TXD96355.1 hypothetical protein ES754_09380 [Psychrobacter frigidicola]